MYRTFRLESKIYSNNDIISSSVSPTTSNGVPFAVIHFFRLRSLISVNFEIPCADQTFRNFSVDFNFDACGNFSQSIIKSDRDKEISDLIEKVKAQQTEGFLFEDGALLKVRRENIGVLKKLLVVPKDLRPDILKMCHDNFMGSHLGQKKTWMKLSNRFYWPNAYKETINHVEENIKLDKIFYSKEQITQRFARKILKGYFYLDKKFKEKI
ncbi:Retrovirus-related Pol poly from transposon [Brachionus plicatilis]|uniref:Retrovirus-related Pol poly from transposon n=1 Tax=Brachionus plicatilis TaxID=10195 RepID=A0A3M7SJI8_BRAPC|nr:Retrovirus-related Pol poly from transposon [Brachionus plicatilis]